MKQPLWTQTLAWLVAAIVAVLLAMSMPEWLGFTSGYDALPHGAAAPR